MESDNKYLLCNAGYNAASVLPDGSVNKCFDKRDSLGNVFSSFAFNSDLTKCRREFCDCPLWSFEKNLYAIAKGEIPDEIPSFDAFFHWHVTYSCNMFCPYCTVIAGDKEKDFKEKSKPAPPTNISAMMNAIDATGLKFLISFIGGEPFMIPNMKDVCEVLTKNKHCVCFNTNLTLFDTSILDVVDWDYFGTLNVSLHIVPMEEKGLTGQFIKKVKEMRSKGFGRFLFTVVSEPRVLANIDYYRDFYAKHNIFFKLIPMFEAGGAFGKPYPDSYTEKERSIIECHWHDEYYPLENI